MPSKLRTNSPQGPHRFKEELCPSSKRDGTLIKLLQKSITVLRYVHSMCCLPRQALSLGYCQRSTWDPAPTSAYCGPGSWKTHGTISHILEQLPIFCIRAEHQPLLRCSVIRRNMRGVSCTTSCTIEDALTCARTVSPVLDLHQFCISTCHQCRHAASAYGTVLLQDPLNHAAEMLLRLQLQIRLKLSVSNQIRYKTRASSSSDIWVLWSVAGFQLLSSIVKWDTGWLAQTQFSYIYILEFSRCLLSWWFLLPDFWPIIFLAPVVLIWCTRMMLGTDLITKIQAGCLRLSRNWVVLCYFLLPPLAKQFHHGSIKRENRENFLSGRSRHLSPGQHFSPDYVQELLADKDLKKKLIQRIELIFLPLLAGTCVLQYIDKSALAYSAVFDLLTDPSTTLDQYSWLGSIFYLAYLFSEYPW